MGTFGEQLPEIVAPPPASGSRQLAGRLSGVESRNVTFLSDRLPIFWEEARGANVRDADGNVYLDLSAAFGVALAGHSNPSIVEAAQQQMKRLTHAMGDVHPPTVKVEFMERLSAYAPWLNARIVLASTGSEAVEIALKTAHLSTGRPGVIAFGGGYHGLTFGALGVTSRPYFREPFEERLGGGVGISPWPDPTRHGPVELDRCLKRVESMLRNGVPQHAGVDDGEKVPVGAVILEPVQGRGGVRVPPPMFLEAVAHLTRMHGALLILDEVFTGAGRCGRFLASERLGIEADLVCLGKALGGGFPLSACMAPRRVMDAWPESPGEAMHTSTFLGHPVACAAGLAFTELLQQGLMDDAEEVGSRMQGMLRDVLEGISGVKEVRGLGAMIGIELADDMNEPLDGLAVRVVEIALEKGVIALAAGERHNVVQLSPPAVLTSDQVLFGVDTLHAAVREALRETRLGT